MIACSSPFPSPFFLLLLSLFAQKLDWKRLLHRLSYLWSGHVISRPRSMHLLKLERSTVTHGLFIISGFTVLVDIFWCQKKIYEQRENQTLWPKSYVTDGRFFNSCIHNLFIYCSSAWGNCSNYLLSRLLQKRAARLLLDADFSQPSASLFSKLKWLPIFNLIILRKLVLLFTIFNNPDSPLCLKRKFNWSAHQSLCF